MKIAIPVWQGRVSPVFDVAQHVLLVELAGDAELARRQTRLLSNQPAQRVRLLGDFGANALICGAISQPLKAALSRSGVQVLDWVCGEIEEVLRAYQTGTLDEDRFAMPGCCEHSRRQDQVSGHHHRHRSETGGRLRRNQG